jgi:hypothetical protein
MKKILLSILAIALTVGTVSASAYALFSDKVEVAGVTMTTGNANLEAYDRSPKLDGNGYNYSSVSGNDIRNYFNTKLTNLYPNFKDYTEVWVSNRSDSKIALNPTLQITTTGGYWTELSNQISMAVVPDDNDALKGDAVYAGAEWHPLSWWKDYERQLPGGVIYRSTDSATEGGERAPEYRGYKILFKGANFDNTLKNITMSGLTFTLNGTQSNVVVY